MSSRDIDIEDDDFYDSDEKKVRALKKQSDRMDMMLTDIYRWLRGDPAYKEKGLIEKFEEVERRFYEIERGYKRIYNLLIGIAVGIGIGGVIFGVWTFKELIDTAK